MTACPECSRRRAYMAADPELYRGDETRCEAHRPSDDAARLDWLERHVFESHWRGTIGEAATWSLEGRARSAVAKMVGHTFREAIDAARAKEAAAAWNRHAPALRWRSEPPDVPGWWWCEYRRGTPAISHYTQEQCSQRRAWPSTPDTRWAGPIPEPEEVGSAY